VLGAEERRMMGFSKRTVFDVRLLLGAIVAALITLAALFNPEPARILARSWAARGEYGAQIASFAFSPTGKQMATTNTAGRIALRAQERGWQIERFLEFPGYAAAVAFSPDGQLLAAAGHEPGICLWNLRSQTSRPDTTIMAPIQRSRHTLFSPDGQSLVVTTHLDGTIFLLDLATRRERMVLHQPSPVACIAFSPDGRCLATGERDNSTIHLWDLLTGSRRMLMEDGPGHTLAPRHATALAFSRDSPATTGCSGSGRSRRANVGLV
jgi:WD40 repeat protein